MWKSRLKALIDPSAWTLLAVCAAPLAFLDPALVLTLAQWCAFGFAFAAITIVMRRLMLPWVDLAEMSDRARFGDLPAAVVVFGVSLLMSSLFVGMVIWAKS